MATMPPITPAFAWAHPHIESSEKAKEFSQPVSNPLLKRSRPLIKHSQTIVNGHDEITDANSMSNGIRSPFSPIDNVASSLRQRRKPPDSSLPPKHSLTDGYFDEKTESQSIEHDGSVVLWDGSSSNAAICEDDFWILVYGFAPKTHYDEVLRRFDSFGRVVSQRGSRSNWVLLRYDNNLEAEKALCQQPCTLADGSIVGVCRMDAKLNQILDFDSNPSWVEKNADGAPHSMSKNGLEENDILLTEETGRRSGNASVCEKFLALLFGWDDVM